MASEPWDPTGEAARAVLVASAAGARRRAVVAVLAPPRGRRLGQGRPARFRVVVASSPDEALRRAGAPIAAAAVDLALPHRGALPLVRALRARRTDLAILAFGAETSASDGMAAIMAGADFFHDCADDPACRGLGDALERALDRRRLTRDVQRAEAEAEAAREKLAEISGDLARALPGFRQPHSRDDVLPFREAARRYLLASARLFEGDARGLSKALGVSYFALRRLLARYEVPFPRSRK